MRCFIAVGLNDEIKDYLYETGLRLRKELKESKISWVAKRNLHLTMKFLGEVDEEKIEEVKKRLKRVEFEEFEVELDKLGVFPNEDFIRVVFIGLQPEERIIKLQQKIDMELLDLFSKEQEFHGHVTLGRMKIAKDKKRIIKVLKENVEKRKMIIDNLQLMKSELHKEGPRYFKLWEKKS